MCLDKDVTKLSVVHYLAKSAPYEPFMLVLPLLYQILSLFTTHAFEASLYSNRQKKSSSSFFSIFNIFSSKKPRGGYHDAPDSSRRVWPSDYDRDNWGVAEPNIDMKAEAFIAKYKKRVSESELYQLDPAAENA
ncbi:unnamed protein product [Sphenostylis stenocarpa]|uniref:Uncharacterized protein n=1 Tax=Sphenostylis stenocarpa TaxID=92480 RepID=A0AA86W3N3_9FABA|nr:unnamed protein product [Sphenostylis stenocarpa]